MGFLWARGFNSLLFCPVNLFNDFQLMLFESEQCCCYCFSLLLNLLCRARDLHCLFLGGRRFQVSDEIGTLVGLLQTSEDHLRARDVLLRVFQILKEGIFTPGDSLSLVGICVGESGGLASFATEDSVQVRSDLVLTASFDSVALRASLNEQLLSLLNVSSWNTHFELGLLELLKETRSKKAEISHVIDSLVA